MTALISNPWTFLALTLVIGGVGAFVTGRAMALTWRGRWMTVAYMLPLTAGVRFLHYALFDETTGVAQALLGFAVLTAYALAGFTLARRRQMQTRYPWLGP